MLTVLLSIGLPILIFGGILAVTNNNAKDNKFNELIYEYYDSENGANRSDLIKLDFQKFQTFFFADPKNWTIHKNSYGYIPEYRSNGKTVRVFFLSRHEYDKFVDWYEESQKKGVDYRNTEATIELADMISANVQKRIEESTAKTVAAYEDMASILNRINEERSKTNGLSDLSEGITLAI